MAKSVHPVHPAAEAFPMLGENELNGLAVDIAANGLRHPIVMTPQGEVLDGRNRLEACRRVKVQPSFETYDGDPWAYSRSVNLWGRNMTTGQRAASCAISLVAEGKRKDGRWARGSVPNDPDSGGSAINDGWAHRMKEAGYVFDWLGMDALVAVRDGHRPLDEAHKKAKAAEDKKKFEEEQERKKREAEMAAGDAELATLVGMWHSEIALDMKLIEQATDPDNWKGVRNLSDKVEQLRKRLKEMADGKLAD